MGVKPKVIMEILVKKEWKRVKLFGDCYCAPIAHVHIEYRITLLIPNTFTGQFQKLLLFSFS